MASRRSIEPGLTELNYSPGPSAENLSDALMFNSLISAVLVGVSFAGD